ncbi:MAG: VCBS repeat-containing protein [Elusimicrobia bacterium]|nr:VCBS repeat-containing protein [Elusimicrobiota bacterium]
MTPVIAAPPPAVRPAASRRSIDPRWPFAALLSLYAVMGVGFLRFNRSAGQILLTVAACCALDVLLARVARRQWVFPLSAYISGLSLALLLNYSHTPWLLFLPVFFTVASKYLLTVDGRHHFNPSLFGVVASLALSGELISTAPAYQWGGSLALSAFLVMAALSLFVFKVGRGPLVASFLGFYVLQILLRAWIMRWHLPPETLLLGTLTSAPFFLFAFYMITDPATSPANPRMQVGVAFAITLVDLLLHKKESLYTFYYAAFAVAGARFAWLHGRRLLREGPAGFSPEWRRAAAVLGALALVMLGAWRGLIAPRLAAVKPAFRLDPVRDAGLDAVVDGDVFRLVDPRVAHVAKWVLSVGDAAAAGDFDGDGRLDLVLTQPLKSPADRLVLLRNTGDLHFARVPVPAFAELAADPAGQGLAAGAVFLDYDDDGDQDLLVPVAFGRTRLFRNTLREAGRAGFVAAAFPAAHGVSVTATALDYDRDGRLDVLVGNVLDPMLREYDPPRPLSLFRLPAAEYAGDRRMFPFMHESWNASDNGGVNVLYRNLGGGRFEAQDSFALGLPETHWTIAAAAGDLDRDGWPDLYLASDFGPDDLYFNRPDGKGGRRFERASGKMFGSVGKDTYKGMNASFGDFDRNGWQDVHVSNVHMPLQAEGSLLWMVRPGKDGRPEFTDEATRRGALNERRFGWGAGVGDLDSDGWLDMVQANGMVDDTLDKAAGPCPDYWYVNEKIMRAPPSIHAYADLWGDIRGRCINARDADRVYLSRGGRDIQQFDDAAPALGWGPDHPSRGVLLADFDDDGDLDVLKTRMVASGALYRNTLREDGAPRHWVGLALAGDGKSCARDAVGTRVSIHYPEAGRPASQLREVMSVNGFSAQSDRRLHYGLGAAAGPVDAEVSWCGGVPVFYRGLAADRYHVLTQGGAR